jgi:hypothetical protein
MTLGEKQRQFTLDVALLIIEAYRLGYELTFGEAYRTPEQAALNAKKGTGIAASLHTNRLAIDLNLFRNGKYLTDTESHRPLGEYWESLRPENRWGGRFTKPDGNHYERRP